jgi:hypothetical protein
MIHLSKSAAAKLKETSRVTIYSNLHLFTLTPEGDIVPDKKFRRWKPKMQGGRIRKFRLLKPRKDL